MQALYFYQKAIISLVPDFSDTDISKNPDLKNSSDECLLFIVLSSKAKTLEKKYSYESKTIDDLKLSLTTYELASKLIDKIKTGYNTEKSKLFLGKQVSEIYENAIKTAHKLWQITRKEHDLEKIFLFTEKAKASVLYQSILESKATEFAGLPDSLLTIEQTLKIDLGFYESRLFEEQQKEDVDSTRIKRYKDKVFSLRRLYEGLIGKFEKNYLQFYNLKYNTATISIKTLQNQFIDEHTALIEYFVGSDSLFIFTITRDEAHLSSIDIDSTGFKRQIESMHSGIINRDYVLYTQNAYQLYKKLLLPIKDKIADKNLMIIPDGTLGYIPFETLLTDEAELGIKNYQKLAYLIKRHQINYHYSASLFAENMSPQPNRVYQNNFAGFAPVHFKR